MINIKNLDQNLLSIDNISFKSTDAVIYNIKYTTIESINHVKIDSKNPPYLIFDNVDGYIEESSGDKYLVFASKDNNKEVLKKYTEIWDEIKNQIKTITGAEPIKYKIDFMKLGFKSGDYLPLGKILSIPSMIIVVGSVFQEDNKSYPQDYLDACLYQSVSEL